MCERSMPRQKETGRRVLLGAVSAAMLMLAATDAAFADIYTPTSESMTDPTIGTAKNKQAAAFGRKDVIIVTSDGNDYQTAKNTELALPFYVGAEATKSKWRIKESYIVIGLAPIMSAGQSGSCCGSMTDFPDSNFAVPVTLEASKEIHRDAWWTVAVNNNSLGTRARNACRNLRKELAQQGLSSDEIFSQDRQTALSTEFRFVARVGHKDASHDVNEAGASSIQWKQSQPSWAKIGVICERDLTSQVAGGGNPDPTPVPTGSNNVAVAFQVNQAALAIQPKPFSGKCPAQIHLLPTIEATGKGVVKYRFVDQLGHHTQQFQVAFEKSEVKFLDHVIEIDAKGKPKGLGLAAAQPQGGALGLAAQTEPNLVQGYFRLEVLSPHKKLSNIADYSVKCTEKTAGAGFTADPGVVKPVIPGTLTVGSADLFIDSVQPSPAVPTKVFVKVTNKGNFASTPTNLKAIRWIGGQATAHGTLVPAIAPGQSEVVLAELGGTIAGASQLYVRVDDPNRIKEQDEGNNSYKVK
jgi:hypothetical protein